MKTPSPNQAFLDTLQKVHKLETEVAVMRNDLDRLLKWRDGFYTRAIMAVTAAAAVGGFIGNIVR